MSRSVIDSPINDVSNKRRAVYTALFPYFSSEALLKAMWIWEDKYTSGHGGSIRRFVAEITQGTRYNTQTRKIFNALTTCFLKPADNLENDPLDTMLAYRAGKINFDEEQATPVLMKIPQNTVFNFIVDNLALLISKENPYQASKVREYFSANIFNIGLSLHQTKEILQWTENQDIFIGMKYSIDEFAKLLHIFYTGICEFFGPQQADYLLNSAIEMADKIPESRQFSPKSFL